MDFAAARKNMVDGQIRPNRINDPRIIAAMLALPRERFLPERLRALAYADNDVPLGNGRVMPAPLSIARLVYFAGPVLGERALVVGAGTGYGAALLSACGAQVVALEEDAGLIGIGRPQFGDAVTVVEGKLAEGCAARGPYDIIVIEGAVRAVPASLMAQLRPGSGRVSHVREGRGLASQILLAQMTPGGLVGREMADCALPALPSLRPAPAFVF